MYSLANMYHTVHVMLMTYYKYIYIYILALKVGFTTMALLQQWPFDGASTTVLP